LDGSIEITIHVVDILIGSLTEYLVIVCQIYGIGIIETLAIAVESSG
jgi:hypothetical protein